MNAPSSVPSRQPGDTRRWKPTPLIAGTAALHAGAAAAVVAQPAAWPWAVGGVVASHLALTAAGLWPRSTLLGPNWTRLPANAGRRIALTIDDGPDPDVTPRVLDLLDRYDARATFFCIGDLARRHPRWIEAIVARGHAIENHSQRHRHVLAVGRRAAARDRGRAADADRAAGTRPLFFRAPAGLRNPFLEPVLAARPAAGELDAARLSTHAHAMRRPSRAACCTASRRATSCSCTTATRRAMRAANRSCSALQAVLRGRRCAIALTTLRALAPQPPASRASRPIRHPFDKI